jgi:hypothetical protein
MGLPDVHHTTAPSLKFCDACWAVVLSSVYQRTDRFESLSELHRATLQRMLVHLHDIICYEMRRSQFRILARTLHHCGP